MEAQRELTQCRLVCHADYFLYPHWREFEENARFIGLSVKTFIRATESPDPRRFLKGFSMPKMTGRPGCWAMEMNGGSSAPYLARTLCVPLFCTLLKQNGFWTTRGGRGSLPLYGGTFAWSYSVLIFEGFLKGSLKGSL